MILVLQSFEQRLIQRNLHILFSRFLLDILRVQRLGLVGLEVHLDGLHRVITLFVPGRLAGKNWVEL